MNRKKIKTCLLTAGYGFVDFEAPQAAELAVQALQAQGIQAQMAKVGTITVIVTDNEAQLLKLQGGGGEYRQDIAKEIKYLYLKCTCGEDITMSAEGRHVLS